MAELFRKVGQHPAAIEQYRAALQLKPNDPDTYVGLTQSLTLANRPQEAVAAAEKGIETARAASQDGAVHQLEEWLNHYRLKLKRAGEGK